MKAVIKAILIIIAVLAVSVSVIIGGFIYQTEFKQNEVNTYFSDDGTYSLTIYQIGDPDWPFGKTDCRFVLYGSGGTISTKDFSVYNDGGNVFDDNFNVQWHEDNVSITVNGEEQSDRTYILYFNGETE